MCVVDNAPWRFDRDDLDAAELFVAAAACESPRLTILQSNLSLACSCLSWPLKLCSLPAWNAFVPQQAHGHLLLLFWAFTMMPVRCRTLPLMVR